MYCSFLHSYLLRHCIPPEFHSPHDSVSSRTVSSTCHPYELALKLNMMRKWIPNLVAPGWNQAETSFGCSGGNACDVIATAGPSGSWGSSCITNDPVACASLPVSAIDSIDFCINFECVYLRGIIFPVCIVSRSWTHFHRLSPNTLWGRLWLSTSTSFDFSSVSHSLALSEFSTIFCGGSHFPSYSTISLSGIVLLAVCKSHQVR